MNRLTAASAAALVLYALATRPTAQTVYPTGTTIYDPDKSWNGFTVLSPLGTPAVLVIDMNGTVVKRWDDFNNSAGGPARVLPGGIVMSASGARPPRWMDPKLRPASTSHTSTTTPRCCWRFARRK